MKTVKILSILLFYFSLNIYAQQDEEQYQFTINLTALKDDKLSIELVPPKMDQKEVIYHLPKVVPGTYAIHNYGAYVSNFKAFDKKGRIINVTRLDENSWKISDISKVQKISYKVDDTWDTEEIKENIFEPSGTNFQKDSVFVLNTFGLFGYFKGFEKKSYQISITKPSQFFGVTSLSSSFTDELKDVFQAIDYQKLTDSPIMYTRPDTATIKLGTTKILVSVYSPNGKINSKQILDIISPILEAQKAYLGGSLPVDNYAFLFYFSDNYSSTRFGALEHSQSSFYFLPEFLPEFQLSNIIKDAVAHEFFHIITPLNIHSEEIANFDFINPKMSKHLWLYEGLIEYATHHAQIKAGLIDIHEFLHKMGQKIQMMQEDYQDDLPFTEMSINVLDKYQDQYLNVYQKGAIIGLCLDIKLRELSNGKYGIQDLFQDLSEKYGKDKSFKDDELFDEIAKLTFPEIRTFFTRYVEGNEPLPLDEIFASVGIKFTPVVTKMEIQLISSVAFNFESGKITFTLPDGNPVELTELGKALGFLPTDEIVSINGQEINSMESFDTVLNNFKENIKENDEVIVVVLRKQTDDSQKEITLRSKAFKEQRTYRNRWDVYNDNTDAINLRNAWGLD